MRSKSLSKSQIISAATKLLRDQQPITFSNLARQLAVRSQTLYNYFPNIRAVKIAMVEALYNDLSKELHEQLIGVSGKEAIMKFMLTTRQFGLDHYYLVRLLLSIPGSELRESKQQQEIVAQQRAFFHTLLAPFAMTKEEETIFQRTLRNLLIGEISNVGSGWFHDPQPSAQDSFQIMVGSVIKQLGK